MHGIISGILIKPELKYTPAGLALLTFTLAGRTDQGKKSTFFQEIVCFGKRAEVFSEKLQESGIAAVVKGRINQKEWTTQEGEKRSKIQVVADLITLYQPAEDRVEQSTSGLMRETGSLNQFVFDGHLGQKVNQNEVGSGTSKIPVSRTSLAMKEFKPGKNGENGTEVTHWIDLEAWGEHAQVLATATQGQFVSGTGFLASESWTDQQGIKHSRQKLEVTSLLIVPRSPSKGKTPASAVGAVS